MSLSRAVVLSDINYFSDDEFAIPAIAVKVQAGVDPVAGLELLLDVGNLLERQRYFNKLPPSCCRIFIMSKVSQSLIPGTFNLTSRAFRGKFPARGRIGFLKIMFQRPAPPP